MNPVSICSCGRKGSPSTGVSRCQCGRTIVVVKNGDVGFTSYSRNDRGRTTPGAVVKDGKLVRG